MLDENIEETVRMYCSNETTYDQWNMSSLREKYMGWLITEDDFKYTDEEKATLIVDDVIDFLTERGHEIYNKREQELGEQIMRDLERMVLLRNVDTKWMDHIDAMDELKKGIGLRGMAQRDPVVEYRLEGYDMFDEMTAAIREDTVRMMLTLKIRRQEDVERRQVAKVTSTTTTDKADEEKKKVSTIVKPAKVGRNDPCPCGSGKKYKKCCGKNL
jgi:preprotein translocase subunit SecA